jgi:hypothetical protein
MKFLLVACAWIYARLIRLYPGRFKHEFLHEMQAVFDDLAHEAAKDGLVPLLMIYLRELLYLPSSIFLEFWHEWIGRKGGLLSRTIPFGPKQDQQGSWKASFFAGLPHLLFAIFVVVLGHTSSHWLIVVSGSIFLLLLIIGLISTIFLTWRDHWPDWTASWYGYAALVIFLFAILPPQGWNPPLNRFLNGAASITLLLISLATLMYWLSRRNPVEGLVMALPMMILYWYPLMEFIPSPIGIWLTAGMFLLGALTATILIRSSNIRWAIWLVLGASMLIGLPIAYARTYWNYLPVEHSSTPSLSQMVGLFSVQFVAGAALAIGPVLGWGLWRLGKSYGRTGRVGAGLIIIGVLVNLFGQFSYWRAVSFMNYFGALGVSFLYQPNRVSAVLIVSISLLVILTGVLLLITLTWRERRLFSAALALLPFVLPVLAMFPIYFGFDVQVPILGLEFVNISAAYNYLLLLAGIAFIFAGGWLVTHLYDQYSAVEGNV